MAKRYLITALLALGACAQTGGNDRIAAPLDEDACPVLDSGDWSAWLDIQPGVLADPMLHIAGKIVLPTPGYSASWRMSFSDRGMPPGQHIVLELTPPNGMVAQVVTTMDVKYEDRAEFPVYRAIIVHCGDSVLAEITDVDEVH